MTILARVLRNEYFDSLVLMYLSNEISGWPGVRQAVILMGTESNRRILAQVGLLTEAAQTASAGDLIIAADLDPGLAESEFLSRLDTRLKSPPGNATPVGAFNALAEALAARPDAHLVSISIPGKHATAQAKLALESGRHVFLFSHHVSLEDELRLKEFALSRGLLMMGPDCGTAILDGCGLGFANAVRQGSIGLVSASGSGLQEVVSLIDRSGGGITQAIGVGGRDLRDPVNGLMAEHAVQILAEDPRTQVIVILAKSASAVARKRVLRAAVASGRPVIADFLSAEDGVIEGSSVSLADTFERAASMAVAQAGLEWRLGRDSPLQAEQIESGVRGLAKSRWTVRGLFAGGSLCAEAAHILRQHGTLAATNLYQPLDAPTAGHMLLDLGAEEYTQARAHPFIDPRLRALEISNAFADDSVAVVLMDVVLGWGCHPDPAGAVCAAIGQARRTSGAGPLVIASLCGTSRDPQGFDAQKSALQASGVTVAESNADAARLAARMLSRIEEGRA